MVRHVDEFARLTERMGYWVDMDAAYWTMDSDYVESVWWSLKQIFEAGLLVSDHRVSPYCPRCGTGLSDHELAQGYEDVVDPSVFVRFPVTGGDLADRYPGVALLVWTTTPWTLVSNVAVAVQPAADYQVVRTGTGDLFVVAAAWSTRRYRAKNQRCWRRCPDRCWRGCRTRRRSIWSRCRTPTTSSGATT